MLRLFCCWQSPQHLTELKAYFALHRTCHVESQPHAAHGFRRHLLNIEALSALPPVLIARHSDVPLRSLIDFTALPDALALDWHYPTLVVMPRYQDVGIWKHHGHAVCAYDAASNRRVAAYAVVILQHDSRAFWPRVLSCGSET